MSAELVFANDEIGLVLDVRHYRLAAIQKAAFRVADRCSSLIGSPENQCVRVSLQFRRGTDEAAAREIARTFLTELLDQELREKVAEETGPVRALILAHAFSKVDLIKRD